MYLPEFVMLVVTTIASIAAGLAMGVSSYATARMLFWIAALSFGSLGVVWSLQTENYSLSVRLFTAFMVGGIAALGLAWGLIEIKSKMEKEKATDLSKLHKSIDIPVDPPKFAPLQLAPTSEAKPATSEKSRGGPVFFKQGAGSIVEGLIIDGVETKGMQADFDIEGTLKNPKISNYKSDARGLSSVHIDHMYIGRIYSEPTAKVGGIQPGNFARPVKNEDGSFTFSIPMAVDVGKVIDVFFSLRCTGMQDFYVTKNGNVVPLKDAQYQSDRSSKIFEEASGDFLLNVVTKNADDKIDIGIDQKPSQGVRP